MKNIINTHCIILKKIPYKERDLHVVLFCKGIGKIVARAKGGLKINSRWGGILETMNLLRVNLYKKNDYFYITETKVIESFLNIKRDLEKSFIAMEVLKLIDKTQIEGENYYTFNLLLNFLKNIEINNEIKNYYYHFLINLLSLEGILFPMDRCIKCGRKLKSPIFFDRKEIGFLCSECAKNPMERVRDETWNTFKSLYKGDFTKKPEDKSIYREVFDILYLTYKEKLNLEIKDFESEGED